MRVFLLLAVVVCLAVPVATGCGPAVPASELGETIFEVPKVPGAESQYPLPECKAQRPANAPPRPRL
jgi:hypothetical protein